MKNTQEKDTQHLDDLFEKYRRTPDSFVFVPLADACRKTGQIEEALEICERGVSRHPGYASGHVVMGKCLFDLGDREKARRVFLRVLTLDENNLVALKFLGTIEADEGNLDTAQNYLQQILALDPENKEIRQILRLVEEQEQIQCGSDEDDRPVSEMDEVDEILETVRPEPSETETKVEATDAKDELETSDELASITLADIFASQGYAKKAEKIYREVLRKQPESALVKRKLAALRGEPLGEPLSEPVVDPVAMDVDVREADSPNECLDEANETAAMSDVDDRVPEFVEITTDNGVETSANASEPASEPAENSDKPLSKRSRRGNRRARKKNASTPPPSPDEARPEISDCDSRNHFKQWLNRVQN